MKVEIIKYICDRCGSENIERHKGIKFKLPNDRVGEFSGHIKSNTKNDLCSRCFIELIQDYLKKIKLNLWQALNACVMLY